MELDFTSPAFWLAVGQIVLIDILLGGDNAVVIALAVRKLDPSKRRQGIVWGTIGAIALRILLIVFALSLLSVPYLKVVGALLLLWIGVKLLLPEEEDAHGNIASSDKLWVAVRTVIVADLVMSIDNVIAIAGASHGDFLLVVLGLLISVPIVVSGSQLIGKLMEKYPVLVVLGAAILGWTGGSMIVHDRTVGVMILAALPQAAYLLPAILAGAVCGIGAWTRRRG